MDKEKGNGGNTGKYKLKNCRLQGVSAAYKEITICLRAYTKNTKYFLLSSFWFFVYAAGIIVL